MREIIGFIAFALIVCNAQADGSVRKFSKAGDWTIYKKSEGGCFAEVPAYPPKTKRVDVLALLLVKGEVVLALTDPHFDIAPGSYPIGIKHNGRPDANGTVMGVVLPGKTRAILVKLAGDQLKGVLTATNITLILGTHEHFFGTNSGNTLERAIFICEKVGVDPFVSDPVR